MSSFEHVWPQLTEKGPRDNPLEHVQRFIWLFFAFLVWPLLGQGKVEYVGGTALALPSGKNGSLEIADEQYFAFYGKDAQVRVPYQHINLIEYGQKVDRRLLMAVVISPVFLLAKSRKHFLTVGYSDEGGKQQVLVFRVDKNAIRATLVGLEARTGLQIRYQDLEARKAGRG